MLVLLRSKAPSTEGVFRKPGNTRVTRELREQLDAGQEVDLEGLPVVLLVALLKVRAPTSVLRFSSFNISLRRTAARHSLCVCGFRYPRHQVL